MEEEVGFFGFCENCRDDDFWDQLKTVTCSHLFSDE